MNSLALLNSCLDIRMTVQQKKHRETTFRLSVAVAIGIKPQKSSVTAKQQNTHGPNQAKPSSKNASILIIFSKSCFQTLCLVNTR